MIHRPQAVERSVAAELRLAACDLCAADCRVDRRRARGVCGAGTGARVFHVGAEWAGEAALVPTATVSFSGCNWRCPFCLTARQSQDAAAGLPFDPDAVAAQALATPGLRSFTILGGEPVIHLPAALALAARIPPGLPLVWKTNATASPAALALLAGQVEVVLADLKHGPACAGPHEGAVWENLHWAARNSRLIVRHLLMPDHLACCTIPALDRLARELPGCRVSLMTGFLPPPGGRCNRPEEVAAARAHLAGLPLVAEPWAVVPARPRASASDEVWIDPAGRICTDSASPDLLAALARLDRELVLGS